MLKKEKAEGRHPVKQGLKHYLRLYKFLKEYSFKAFKY